jgi:hypothetical protein
MKIRPVGAKLFQADGRKDMTKLILAFRNSVNAPKNGSGVCWRKVTYWMKVDRKMNVAAVGHHYGDTNQRLFPPRKITTSGSVKVIVSCVRRRDPFLENM